jgi:hypothetical protein
MFQAFPCLNHVFFMEVMLIISASHEVEGIDKRSSAVLESCQSVSVRRPSFGRPKPALGPAREPELMALPGRTPPVGRATGRSVRLWWVGKKKRDNDRDEEAMLESWSPGKGAFLWGFAWDPPKRFWPTRAPGYQRHRATRVIDITRRSWTVLSLRPYLV